MNKPTPADMPRRRPTVRRVTTTRRCGCGAPATEFINLGEGRPGRWYCYPCS